MVLLESEMKSASAFKFSFFCLAFPNCATWATIRDRHTRNHEAISEDEFDE